MLFDDIERAEKLTDKMLAVAEKENLSIGETRLAIEDLQIKFDFLVEQYHKKINFAECSCREPDAVRGTHWERCGNGVAIVNDEGICGR